jgi:hypothetical protein
MPLYVIPEHRGLRMQVRPLAMFMEEFMEEVELAAERVPRFKYIGPEL